MEKIRLEYRTETPTAQIEDLIRGLLELLGEDPEREGLIKTPHRVAAMYAELLEGYNKDITKVVNGALYDVDVSDGEMIIVDNITYDSICEHHLLPFSGKAHVAYIPGEKIIGLSKIPRIVDVFARRLQVQERVTNQIADCINEILNPAGVIVVMAGHHSCSSLRGVKKHGVNMKTIASRGEFVDNRQLRNEFFQLLKTSSD
ncbi:MAG: GTP cyclohydrolase I FolE [Candidatus Heimdallarchaeota archaeon]|nr:GTP cyclohydrolase I FolE [Candidatus Heimdallarchaeota archaeon]